MISIKVTTMFFSGAEFLDMVLSRGNSVGEGAAKETETHEKLFTVNLWEWAISGPTRSA